jgi:hypothetical protein
MYPSAGFEVELPATSQVPWSLLITLPGSPLLSASWAVQLLAGDAIRVVAPTPEVPMPMKTMLAAPIAMPPPRRADPLNR